MTFLQQPPPTHHELADFRADPANWSRFGIYRCARDPRLMVRDRINLGWTLNMGHPRAQTVIWSILAGTIVVTLALGFFVARTTWL